MNSRIIDIKDITKGLPGLTPVSGQHLYEGCVICLSRHKHRNKGTVMEIENGSLTKRELVWEDIYNEQLDRTWADQFYATEHGAVCIAILIALQLTDYTVIEKSARKNGFDYWLGSNDDILFQRKARLEISGIFKAEERDLKKRYNIKVKQTDSSDDLQIPAYIGIVEFSKPYAKFGKK